MSRFEKNIRRVIWNTVKCLDESQNDEEDRRYNLGQLAGIVITLDNLSRKHFEPLRQLIMSTYASDVIKNTFTEKI